MQPTEVINADEWMMQQVQKSLTENPLKSRGEGGDDSKVHRGPKLSASVRLKIARPARRGSVMSRQLVARSVAAGESREFEIPEGTELTIYRRPDQATSDRRIAAYMWSKGQLVLFGDRTCKYREF